MNDVLINTRTGARGSYRDWVTVFSALWAEPAHNVERFMDVLDPAVRLIAPGVPTTVGHAAGRRAFERLFKAIPDMRGEVLRWSAQDEVLFIEMNFSGTIGRRLLTWPNVDRFVFAHGAAVERVAYFDPSAVRVAFGMSPRAWRQFAMILWGI